jgi:hypothetical protein
LDQFLIVFRSLVNERDWFIISLSIIANEEVSSANNLILLLSLTPPRHLIPPPVYPVYL